MAISNDGDGDCQASSRSLGYVELTDPNPASTGAFEDLLHILDKSTFGKRNTVLGGNDEMIQHSHVHERQGLF